MKNSGDLLKKAEEISLDIYKNQALNKVFNAISAQEQNLPQAQNRWIWELFINAKEAAQDDEVSLKITLGNGFLEFSHTGKPFTTSDLVCLIELTSEKQMPNAIFNQKDSYFRSGGGFSSVFLLSKKVSISGIWQNQSKKSRVFKEFSFVLDRTARTRSDLQKVLNDDYKIFKRIEKELELENYQPGKKYDTVFRFELDERGCKVAEAGLQDLRDYAYFALLFNREVTTIKVNDKVNHEQTEYSIGRPFKRLPEDNVELFKSNDNERIFLLMSCSNNQSPEQIALEVSRKQLSKDSQDRGRAASEILKKQEFRLIDNDKPSRIFARIPIIGFQEFPFPAVVNSPRICFNEQKAVIINGKTTEAQTNSKVMATFMILYQELISFICISESPRFFGRHFLLSAKGLEPSENSIFKDHLQKTLSIFCDLPMIEASKSKMLKISKCSIPIAEPKFLNDFYDLVEPIYMKTMIKKDKDLILYWSKVLNYLPKEQNESPLIDKEKIMKLFEKKRSIDSLKKALEVSDEQEILSWLAKLYCYLDKSLSDELFKKTLEENALIPNKNGDFKRLNELFDEASIPYPLAEALQKIGSIEFMSDKIKIQPEFGNEIKKTMQKVNQGMRNGVEKAIQEIKDFLNNDKIKPEKKVPCVLCILSISPEKVAKDFDLLILNQQFLAAIKLFFPQFSNERASIAQDIFELWKKAEDLMISYLIDLIEKSKTLPNLSMQLGKKENFVSFNLINLYEILAYQRMPKIMNRKVFYQSPKKEFLEAKDLLRLNFVNYKAIKTLVKKMKNSELYQVDCCLFQESEIPKNTIFVFNDPSNLSNPLSQEQNLLVSMNISNTKQLKKILQDKMIKIPQINLNMDANNQNLFDKFAFVKAKQKEANSAIKNHLKKQPDYELSLADFDENSKNKNILRNVQKITKETSDFITIVARPMVKNKVMIHNKKECEELQNPKNELWVSDGKKVLRVQPEKLRIREYIDI